MFTYPTRNRIAYFYGVNGWLSANGSVTVPVVAGQTAQVIAQVSGGAKTVSLRGTGQTRFSGQLLS
jgi:hypothetical protein